MKKIISSLLFVMFVSLAVLLRVNYLFAQVSNTESFDDVTFPPANWSLDTYTTTGGGGPPGDVWVRSTFGLYPPNTTPHTGTGMARFRSHSYTTCYQSLFTPLFDLSGLTAYDTATISFWMFRDTGLVNSMDSVVVSINTVNDIAGSTHIATLARLTSVSLPDTVQPVNGWYYYSFNLPPSFNGVSNYVIFSGYGLAGNHMYIDDVEWISYPPQCNSTPTIGSINASPMLICGGNGTSTLSLNGQTSGMSGLSITWQTSGSATGPWTDVATGVSTYITDTLDVTTYFRCYISCANTSTADTSTVITISISPNPIPVLTVAPINGSYCSGSAGVILTVSGAENYTWSPSAGLDNTTGELVIATPAAATTYTVTGSDSSGCEATATSVITIANSPSVNPNASDDTVCTGSAVNLTAGGFGGGNQYTWNPGGFTGNNVTVNPTVTTTYTLTATNFQGCTTIDSSIIIIVTQDVTADFGFTQLGNTIIFHDSSINASSWLWLFGDGNMSANQNPVYSYSGTGTYMVTLIVNSAGCPGGDTIQIPITIFPEGIEETESTNTVHLYPNPVSAKQLNLYFTQPINSVQLTIYNEMGMVVLTDELKAVNSRSPVIINVENLVPGIYEVRVNNDGVISKSRFSILQ